jgi:hypothetical protein
MMKHDWTINGQQFTRTRTERGVTRYFIDGKPAPALEWRHKMRDARQAEDADEVIDLSEVNRTE